MSASLQLDGVRELVAALEALPDELRRNELGPVVSAHAEALVSELRATYPKHTGTLAARVAAEPSRKGDPLFWKVRSKAPHAHLYEYGTIGRFTKGTGAYRGIMPEPAQPVFVPAAIRVRERMIRAVKGALQSLRVPGFTGSPEVRES